MYVGVHSSSELNSRCVSLVEMTRGIAGRHDGNTDASQRHVIGIAYQENQPSMKSSLIGARLNNNIAFSSIMW